MEPIYFNSNAPELDPKNMIEELMKSDIGLLVLAVVGLVVILTPLYFFAAGSAGRRESEPAWQPPAPPAPAPVVAPGPVAAAPAPVAPPTPPVAVVPPAPVEPGEEPPVEPVVEPVTE